MLTDLEIARAAIRGQTLKELRRCFGLSQVGVASKSCLEQWRLRDIENGEGEPTPSEMWAISDGLKMRHGLLEAMIEGVFSRTRATAQRLLSVATTAEPWREALQLLGCRGLHQLAYLAARVQCRLDDIKTAARLSEPHIPRRVRRHGS